MRSPELVHEQENEPHFKRLTIFFGRHANRTPGGKLTEEGKIRSGDVGAGLTSEPGHTTVTSDQDRAIDTAAIQEANMARPSSQNYARLQTEGGDVAVESYMAERTTFDTKNKFGKDRQPAELFYSAVVDVKPITKIISDASRDKWIADHGEQDRVAVEAILYKKGDTAGLSDEDIARVAAIKNEVAQLRESLQHIGINELFEDPERANDIHKLAGATASTLVSLVEEAKTGKPQGEKTALVVSHSGFLDALLKKTMGFEKLQDIGGHQQPVETYEIDVEFDDQGDVKTITIPVPANRKDAPAFMGKDRIEIKWDTVKSLAEEFKATRTP